MEGGIKMAGQQQQKEENYISPNEYIIAVPSQNAGNQYFPSNPYAYMDPLVMGLSKAFQEMGQVPGKLFKAYTEMKAGEKLGRGSRNNDSTAGAALNNQFSYGQQQSYSSYWMR